MKKLLTLILALTFITISMANVAMAKSESNANSNQHGSTEEKEKEGSSSALIDPRYEQPIIPKSNYLPGPREGLQENAKRVFGTQILPNIAVMMIGFVGGLALVFLIIGGVRYVTAYGNEEAIGNAKNQVIFSIVGFLLALLSYAIVAILTNIKFVNDTTNRTGESSDEQVINDTNNASDKEVIKDAYKY